MMNRRSFVILLSALVLAGAGFTGCDDKNWTCEECVQDPNRDPDDVINGPQSNDFKGLANYTASELKSADSKCKNADSCMDSGSCTSGAGYAACQCAQGGVACQNYDICKGIGSCEYTCGEKFNGNVNTCSWAVC